MTALVLLAALVTGCSRSAEEVRTDYCQRVEEEQARLSEILAEDSPATLLRALPVFRELAEDAPRDISDDWGRVLDALTGLERALEDAGVDPADYDAAEPPDGVDRAEQQAIAGAADQVARRDVAQSFEGVQQQAIDVCKTPLYR